MEERLAKITECNISRVYDGKFLGMNIVVMHEDSGLYQNILGGICLYNHYLKDNKQSSYAPRIMYEVLHALNIDTPEQAIGKYIWVIGFGEGLSFRAKGFKTMKVDGVQTEVSFDIKDEEKPV